MGLANISIVGNLVKAPEQMQLASGKLKTTLVVAVNHAKKDESESADYYNVVAWGRLAELAGQYLDKGQQVTATGRLTLDRWTDKNGQARVTPVINADQIAFPRRSQPDFSGGETDMGKTFSKGESVRAVKFKEADVGDNDFDDVDEEAGEEDEDEEVLERVKGVFADTPPVKGGRKRAKTA